MCSQKRRCNAVILAVALACLTAATRAYADSPYATEVVDYNSAGLGSSPYDDPNALLGSPSTTFYDPWAAWSGGDSVRVVKLVEPAYNMDGTNTDKLITTIGRKRVDNEYQYSSVTVEFDSLAYDDPANPYGIDFEVFGNSFYVGGGTAGGFVNDEADMDSYYLAGGIFTEPVVVSVSPGYQGLNGEVEDNPDTWQWYTYTDGPYGDTTFPTQAYAWNQEQYDATGYGWVEDEQMDFTKPVNPALDSLMGTTDSGSPYYEMSAANAIDLYSGSGGGTGFDLAESGFDSIQYIRVEATSAYYSGEIDAFSDVRPMVVGDNLTVTADNIAGNTATLYFQNPDDTAQTMIRAEFTAVDDILRMSTGFLTDADLLALATGEIVSAYELSVAKILDPETAPSYLADVWLLADGYAGDGSDLSVLLWNGTAWESLAFTFDSATNMVQLDGWSDPSAYLVVSQAVPEPSTLLLVATGGVIAVIRRKRRNGE